MKKILLLFLCVISFNAIQAEIKWTLSADGTLTISGTGDMPDIDLPSSSPWSSQRDKIKKVVIKDGVTSIGDAAFYYCSGFTSLTIPNSVTSIGEWAFDGCSGLTSLTIPNSVTSIGGGAFNGCSGLTSLTIGNSVTSIGHDAFNGCSGLTSVTIPNSVTSIGESAFLNCSGLTSLTIPNSVTRIGENAFSGCYSLTSLTIGNSVTSIEHDAFNGCFSLTSVTIPNSVTSIGGAAFSGCSSLTSVTIPNSVTSIGGAAFSDCSGLTSVTIPNSVTSIGYGAFYGTKWYDNQPDGVVYAGKVLYAYKGTMPSNTKIDIKEGTTGITPSAFSGCLGLTSVTIPNSVTSIEGDAFNGCSGLTSLSIPNSVTSIGDYAFEGCSGLTSVTIPNSVTSIGVGAFSGCYGLTSLTIPNSVTSIRGYAFSGCYGLTSLTIPNSVTSIGEDAFSGCSGLTSLTIPNSVTSIGDCAFIGCSGLNSITCEASIPPYCQEDFCFYEVNKSIPVYVPANSIDEYKNANVWKDFTNIQAIPNTYTLTDGTPYTNNSQLDGRDISYTRTFNNTAWQALYIPFSLKYEDWKDNFEVAYINNLRQLDTDDDGVIDKTIMDVVKIKDGSLIPNTPYLIKAKSVGEKTLSINNATLYATKENSIDCRTTIAEYTFTGTYNAISASTLIANNYYTMGGGALIMTDGNSGLKPYRWYMKIEARSPMYNVSNAAKAITINVVGEEETTTDVEDLRMINYKSPVYDLNGRKVHENNLKPGIYVKNGKKFIVK